MSEITSPGPGPVAAALRLDRRFAATYLVMLVSLLFTGGGRYTSADYYLDRYLPRVTAH